jgi:FKBP-type peptidyl-prolyl cis-trans isomerase
MFRAMRSVRFLAAAAGAMALSACSAAGARPPAATPAEDVVVIAHAPLPASAQNSSALPPDNDRAPHARTPVGVPDVEGLVIEDDVVGTGSEVVVGDRITVQYVGRLEDGTEFDNSWKRNSPAQFQIGRGMLIKGWDKGLIGMRVGGRRRLVVPASLGYGARGRPPVIPQFATLLFDIELVSIP